MSNMYFIIENLLINRGIPRKELEETTGISRSLLSELKSGRTKKISSDKLSKIAAYLGVSTDYLLTGEESSQNFETKKEPSSIDGNLLDTKKKATSEEQPLDDDRKKLIEMTKRMNQEEIADLLNYIEIVKLRRKQ